MKKVRSAITSGVASLGLVVGLAAFAGATSGTIDTTGPDSYNKVLHKTKNKVEVTNNNNVSASNSNNQGASSGDAKVKHNTDGGSARSGDARNSNALNASLTVDNTDSAAGNLSMAPSASNSGTIRNTGPDSYNKVVIKHKNQVTVTNNNNLSVSNSNSQSASTGDARVSDNTDGGNATSGDATNTNTTTLTFRVSN